MLLLLLAMLSVNLRHLCKTVHEIFRVLNGHKLEEDAAILQV